MKTKLTLRMERDIIEKAKHMAQRKGKSLSRIVADYLEILSSAPQNAPLMDEELPPAVRAIKGSLADNSLGVEDYKRYLEEKHQ